MVKIFFSNADAAVLAKLTGVRVIPSDQHTAGRLSVYFDYHDRVMGRWSHRTIEAALATKPQTLAFADSKLHGPNSREMMIAFDAKPGSDGRPVCIADLELVGAAGKLDLPGLSLAIKAAAERDAQLARLTNDRDAFARAYLTSFRWAFLNVYRKESDWEASWYTFRADGTYESETAHRPSGVERIQGRWSMNKEWTVLIDGRPHKLGPCYYRRGYLCFADHFFPLAAW